MICHRETKIDNKFNQLTAEYLAQLQKKASGLFLPSSSTQEQLGV
jgi:hypothetical protein